MDAERLREMAARLEGRTASDLTMGEIARYLRAQAAAMEEKTCPPHGPWLESAEQPARQCQRCGRWFEAKAMEERETEAVRLLRACRKGMARYDWDVMDDGVSMPHGERTLRGEIDRFLEAPHE